VVLEIEERKEFLNQMTVLGKRKEYQEIISNEIADVSRIKITEKYISSFYV
jgi:hypothetical protein